MECKKIENGEIVKIVGFNYSFIKHMAKILYSKHTEIDSELLLCNFLNKSFPLGLVTKIDCFPYDNVTQQLSSIGEPIIKCYINYFIITLASNKEKLLYYLYGIGLNK